jgi:hypothetical protein
MIAGRTVLRVMAGSALLGLPLATAGVATAHEAPSQSPSSAKTCTETGTASNSPGSDSGNVTQVPTLNCSDVFGSPAVAVTGPLVGAPAGGTGL